MLFSFFSRFTRRSAAEKELFELIHLARLEATQKALIANQKFTLELQQEIQAVAQKYKKISA